MNTLSQDASTDSSLKPFDGTPIQASLFLRNIGEFAAKKGFLTLLLRSYYISRDQIVVANADLIPILRNHFTTGFPLNDDIQNPPDPPVEATRNAAYTPTTADNKLYTASPELFVCVPIGNGQ